MVKRTPEQIEADERVTQAIENWLRVYEFDGSAEGDGVPRVLTDYVVLTATQGFMPDGDTVTGHPYILRDNTLPLYRAIGLVQTHLVMFKDLVLGDDDELE